MMHDMASTFPPSYATEYTVQCERRRHLYTWNSFKLLLSWRIIILLDGNVCRESASSMQASDFIFQRLYFLSFHLDAAHPCYVLCLYVSSIFPQRDRNILLSQFSRSWYLQKIFLYEMNMNVCQVPYHASFCHLRTYDRYRRRRRKCGGFQISWMSM